MTNARSDTSGKTATHSCCNDSVVQLGPFGSGALLFEIVEFSDACFVYILLQYAPHAVVNRI